MALYMRLRSGRIVVTKDGVTAFSALMLAITAVMIILCWFQFCRYEMVKNCIATEQGYTPNQCQELLR